ncbi:MAG: hypothetical protein R3F43_23010 [bacterium]
MATRLQTWLIILVGSTFALAGCDEDGQAGPPEEGGEYIEEVEPEAPGEDVTFATEGVDHEGNVVGADGPGLGKADAVLASDVRTELRGGDGGTLFQIRCPRGSLAHGIGVAALDPPGAYTSWGPAERVTSLRQFALLCAPRGDLVGGLDVDPRRQHVVWTSFYNPRSAAAIDVLNEVGRQLIRDAIRRILDRADVPGWVRAGIDAVVDSVVNTLDLRAFGAERLLEFAGGRLRAWVNGPSINAGEDRRELYDGTPVPALGLNGTMAPGTSVFNCPPDRPVLTASRCALATTSMASARWRRPAGRPGAQPSGGHPVRRHELGGPTRARTSSAPSTPRPWGSSSARGPGSMRWA